MTRPIFSRPAERIMVALDVDEMDEAKAIIDQLKDTGVVFKVGNQLGTYEGWKIVIEYIHSSGAKIFCDTKFKDIPETVKKSSQAIARRQPDFFNVMADAQIAALEGAVEGAAKGSNGQKPIVLGVTVLTSISDQESQSIYGASPAEKVVQFASNAARAGLDGVVCSAQEASLLRSNPETSGLLLVTPGVRPAWAVSGDQSRVTTPSDAVAAGADYLVIGRPITQPPAEIGSPKDALQKIIEELNERNI